MHLLNAETFQLETFLDDNKRPKYAILSHTWGAEEVTYQEITNLEQARLKSGFLKIQYTCEQAIKDGSTHAWVDTCCIDKTSSAELSEAINSMFKWYQDAEICYAYLPDVGVDGRGLLTPFDVEDQPNTHIDDSHGAAAIRNSVDSSREADIRRGAAIKASRWSRWFTRGWTLQELIAPRRLHFFAEPWKLVGVLSKNAEQVFSITNIPTRLLRKKISLGSYSIARRMSWASHRVTTRAEDEAYCLLGILGVNMPLLYGEGRMAFLRLQEEVIRITTDDSFLAWTCDSKAIRADPAGYRWYDAYPLASSPLQYAKCGYIAPGTGLGRSWSMTNRGLKINLPLAQVNFRRLKDRSHFLASLSCHDERDIAQPLYIGLRCQIQNHKHHRKDPCDRFGLESLEKWYYPRVEVNQLKSPVNREITVERYHRTAKYGSHRQLYIRYVSFNPYQRIELPFRPLHTGNNDKWAAPLSLDYAAWPDDALLDFELQVECTTSIGPHPGVQMQREPGKDVCSIHVRWDTLFPWELDSVRIDATRDAGIDANQRDSPYEIRPLERRVMIDAGWAPLGSIHHLNERFDIGARLYESGKDQILLVFVAPRRDTGAWKASAKTSNLFYLLGRTLAWFSRNHHGDLPIWATGNRSTPADWTFSLDSSSPPVTHITDEAAAYGLRRLQKSLWSERAFDNCVRDLKDSKRSGKWLHVAWNLAKLHGLGLGGDIPRSFEHLQNVYYEPLLHLFVDVAFGWSKKSGFSDGI